MLMSVSVVVFLRLSLHLHLGKFTLIQLQKHPSLYSPTIARLRFLAERSPQTETLFPRRPAMKEQTSNLMPAWKCWHTDVLAKAKYISASVSSCRELSSNRYRLRSVSFAPWTFCTAASIVLLGGLVTNLNRFGGGEWSATSCCSCPLL